MHHYAKNIENGLFCLKKKNGCIILGSMHVSDFTAIKSRWKSSKYKKISRHWYRQSLVGKIVNNDDEMKKLTTSSRYLSLFCRQNKFIGLFRATRSDKLSLNYNGSVVRLINRMWMYFRRRSDKSVAEKSMVWVVLILNDTLFLFLKINVSCILFIRL